MISKLEYLSRLVWKRKFNWAVFMVIIETYRGLWIQEGDLLSAAVFIYGYCNDLRLYSIYHINQLHLNVYMH